MTHLIVKAQKSYLKSPLTSSATSVILRSLKDSKGNNLTMANFGDFGVIVIKQGDTIEMIKFSSISTASDDTATLTVATNGRNLDPTYPYAGSTIGLDFQSGAEAIITNDPLTVMQFGNLNNAQTWALLQTFAVAPISNTDAVAGNELVRKSQLDNAVLGSLTLSSVVVPATAGETVAVDQVVYLDVANGKWKLADADTASQVENVILGITRGAGTNGNIITNGVTIYGLHQASSAIFTANTKYFVSNTAGGFSTTAGTKEVSLGYAHTTERFYFCPRYDQKITEDIQDALEGTSGTPKSTNKYATENDTTNGATITGTTISFDAASKEIRDSGNGFVTANFRAGQTVTVSGSNNNDGNYTVVSVSAGVIVVEESVIDEPASASITIEVAKNNKLLRLDANGKLPAFSAANLTEIPLGKLKTQVFTSSGIWIKPPNVSSVFVKVVGGGGGSGATNFEGGATGGGGSGGYAEAVVAVSGNVAVTVGNGGAGGEIVSGPIYATDGSNGGASSFAGDTIVIANGGNGGFRATSNSLSIGGAGGSTTNGDIGITGQKGQDAYFSGAKQGGRGGSNPLGIGGYGDTDSGSMGIGFGAGGGGVAGINKTGNAGTDGVVIVQWIE